MKADDRDIATVERLFDTLELREPIGNATRAKHLECAEDNHASAQIVQGQWFTVEPAGSCPRLGLLGIHGLHPFQWLLAHVCIVAPS
jgi:hypothetical protein